MKERKHPGSVASWRWELAPRSGIPAPHPEHPGSGSRWRQGPHCRLHISKTRCAQPGCWAEEKQSLPQAVSGGPSHLRSVLGLWGG